MADLPEHIRARRTAREAESRARAAARRRRRLSVGAIVAALVAIAAVAMIVLTAGGAATRRPTAAATPARATTVRPTPRAEAVRGRAHAALEARGVARIRNLATLGLPVYCAGPRGDALAFTFDDGPGPYTRLALHKLAQAGERATFFVVGRSMANFPGWVQRERSLAAIGDHTMTHPFLPGLPPDAITSQITGLQPLVEAAAGAPVTLFRPPYGARNPTVDATARRLGLLDVLWSVDSRDSLGANWAGIIQNVEAGMHPGAIILMHENRGQTIRALTTLLPELHRRHLRSVSLPELFATDPPSAAQLRAGTRGCGVGGAVRTGA